jgi:hypothetical protein
VRGLVGYLGLLDRFQSSLVARRDQRDEAALATSARLISSMEVRGGQARRRDGRRLPCGSFGDFSSALKREREKERESGRETDHVRSSDR